MHLFCQRFQPFRLVGQTVLFGIELGADRDIADRQERVNRGIGHQDLFPSSHLRFQPTPGVESDGPTLTEIVAHGQTCRQLIDQVLAMDLSQPVRACVEEDERLFTYAERTVAYYDTCVRAFQLARQGKIDRAKPFFNRAKEIAQFLRQDTLSTSKSYSPIIPNALVASEAEKALEHLAKLLDAGDK